MATFHNSNQNVGQQFMADHIEVRTAVSAGGPDLAGALAVLRQMREQSRETDPDEPAVIEARIEIEKAIEAAGEPSGAAEVSRRMQRVSTLLAALPRLDGLVRLAGSVVDLVGHLPH